MVTCTTLLFKLYVTNRPQGSCQDFFFFSESNSLNRNRVTISLSLSFSTLSLFFRKNTRKLSCYYTANQYSGCGSSWPLFYWCLEHWRHEVLATTIHKAKTLGKWKKIGWPGFGSSGFNQDKYSGRTFECKCKGCFHVFSRFITVIFRLQKTAYHTLLSHRYSHWEKHH